MGGDELEPVDELFSLRTVILAEPRRSLLRTYHGPKMHLAAEDGTVLAHLHERGTFAYALRGLGNRHLLGVDLVSRRALARPRFQLTDAGGRPIGEVYAPGRVNHTRLLDIRSGNDTLRFTRTALLGKTWLVRDHIDCEVGRVTVSSVRSLDGLQQYRVESDRSAGSEQRRLIVAATVCLQVIRRWLAAPQGSPA
ncbi:hypothetical protein ACFVZW_07580 [Streptomyces sp. NPDC059567]|uniref:hypothetical protein n=1 Tax=Streptomyces sp. NPDC059567 TaxID=3346867 RepID=UPI0036A897A3